MSFNRIPFIMNCLIWFFWAVIIIGFVFRIVQNHLTRLISVKARVIDKYHVPYVQYGSRIPKNVTDYTVAFDCNGKTKKFFVSLWVYDTLNKGDQGTLHYRGSRFVQFDHNAQE